MADAAYAASTRKAATTLTTAALLRKGKGVRALRFAVLAAAATLTGMFLYVVLRRLAFPYELEWMTGSVMDHVERVREGQPLYAPPTADWIPYLYPPLYYWLAALLPR